MLDLCYSMSQFFHSGRCKESPHGPWGDPVTPALKASVEFLMHRMQRTNMVSSSLLKLSSSSVRSVRSLLVAMPGAPSSFLFLVAMPGGLKNSNVILDKVQNYSHTIRSRPSLVIRLEAIATQSHFLRLHETSLRQFQCATRPQVDRPSGMFCFDSCAEAWAPVCSIGEFISEFRMRVNRHGRAVGSF